MPRTSSATDGRLRSRRVTRIRNGAAAKKKAIRSPSARPPASRRIDEGMRASLVSRETTEEGFAQHRQLFLTEQGYAYEIAVASPPAADALEGASEVA